MNAKIVGTGAEASGAKSAFVIGGNAYAAIRNDLCGGAGNKSMIHGTSVVKIEFEAFKRFAVFVGDLAKDYGFGSEFDNGGGSVGSNLDELAKRAVVAKHCTWKIVWFGNQDDGGASGQRGELKAAIGVSEDRDGGVGREGD